MSDLHIDDGESQIEADLDDQESRAIKDAATSLLILERGSRWLRIAAYVSLVLWLIALVSAFWAAWDQLSATFAIQLRSDAGVDMDSNRMPQVVTLALTSTWQYLLITVVAYSAGLWVESRRLPILMNAVDVADERDTP